MFTPGFLLVDDEVIGVRVENADDGDLYDIDDKDGDDVEDSSIKMYKDETSDVDNIDDRNEDDFENTFEGRPPSFQEFASSWQGLNL